MPAGAPDFRIEVEGLKELRAVLRNVERSFGRDLGQAGKRAADIVAAQARSKVPVATGRAQSSVRATAGRGGSVVEGGSKAPYLPWLDFGGRVGRNRSVERPFLKAGRYLYPALAEKRDEVRDSFADLVVDIVRKAGLDG